MSIVKNILISMRPKQWAKNLFLFAGIIFALKLLELNLLMKVVAAFLCFSGVSGSVYILNDIIDRDKDRSHPEKSKRPIASGNLKIKTAYSAMFVILIISLFLADNIK